MTNYKQLNVRMPEELYNKAHKKCKDKFDISLSALIKVFLTSFTTQKGLGFYIGDDDICQLFQRWIIKKRLHKDSKGGYVIPYPRLKDLYDLGNKKARTNI